MFILKDNSKIVAICILFIALMFVSVLFVKPNIIFAGVFPVTITLDSGSGSLREAIKGANNSAGPDTVSFNITDPGPHLIRPLSLLPVITDALVIDGTKQPEYTGSPVIRIGGVLAGSVSGLVTVSDNVTVRGLAITGFQLDGIRIWGNNCVVEGCYIGTDLSGTVSIGNSGNGITIYASENRIGGTTESTRNIISGNRSRGILITLPSADTSRVVNNNIIQGNYIGTDITGTKSLGNTFAGVVIIDAVDNLVGGSVLGAGNLISNNGIDGIHIRGILKATTGNSVLGNFIGTDISGNKRLANGQDGVAIVEAANNNIGATVPGAGNLISANNRYGVLIFGGRSSGNQIQGNFIGSDSSGTAALRNNFGGVIFLDASGNKVGGAEPGARNLISGNGSYGVSIGLFAAGVAESDTIEGNFIGTDVSGSFSVANTKSGILLEGTTKAVIKDNLISGNSINGFEIDGTIHQAVKTEHNTITGNLIGVNVSGSMALPNKFNGIKILRSTANQIGGTTAKSRNVISGNKRHAIEISSFGSNSANNIIQGNYIGLDSTGTTLLPNELLGVFTVDVGASKTIIGGTESGAGNIIAGHEKNVILSSGNNLVQGNIIGADIHGTSLGGIDSIGVWVINVSNNIIGGVNSGAGNIIAGHIDAGVLLINSSNDNLIAGNAIYDNDRDGVRITQSGVHNTISQNSIFNNSGLGIALGDDDVTANDLGDVDTGPNDLQNHPVITLANNTGDLTVEGGLATISNSQFIIELFYNTECDTTIVGEGKTFLESLTVNTNTDGNAEFSTTFPGDGFVNGFVTATATDAAGSTSEFSRCIEIKALPTAPQLVAPKNSSDGHSTDITFRWQSSSETNSYHLQVSTTRDFFSIFFEDSTLADTSQLVQSLQNLTAYNWRVRGRNVFGWGVFSEIYQFDVGTLPIAPVLLEPVNDATELEQTVAFRWLASETAESYYLQIAIDAAFNSLVFADSVITDTTTTVDSLKNGVEYFWRISARNALGWGIFSKVFGFTVQNLTYIKEVGHLPGDFVLQQNYPNPFNPQTSIRYALPSADFVKLDIFDLLGRKVALLVNSRQQAGWHEVSFNAKNIANGIYVYRIQAGNFVQERKMLVLK